MTLRERLYLQLHPAARKEEGLSPTNRLIALLIVLSAAVAVLETEALVHDGREGLFFLAEMVFSLLFAAEFAGRLWTSAEHPDYGPGLAGKLRYLRSPAAIFDMLALLPIFLTALGAEAFLLRLARLLRILRLARLGRFSVAMSSISEAIRSRREELLLSLGVAALVLVISSALLYLVEGGVQPENFGSIPRAMWWSIVTLTTVGYGDVFPMTAVGRILAAITAVTGIGLIAMPAGILAASFSDAMKRQRETAG